MISPANKLIWPEDPCNLELLSHVHPSGYVNPAPQGRYNLVVIGGGTAGLVAAVGAASLGAKVALVERHLLGGHCLNVGTLPSQALIRSARAAHDLKRAGDFGLKLPSFEVDFPAVMQRLRKLRAGIASSNSVQSLKQKGVDVYFGEGRFLDSSTLEVSEQKLLFSRAVIACGARPTLPAIPGIDEIEPLTSENLFCLTELPKRLAAIGAGSFGAEMAQAFARLGSVVTVYDINDRFLHREDPDAAAAVRKSFEQDGIRFRLGAANLRFKKEGATKIVSCDVAAQSVEDHFDHVLLATGRTPNVEGMNLDRIGVEFNQNGVKVNDQLRTTNRRIYACGDVASQFKFPHAADALARIVIGNALFFSNAKASALNIPSVIYTDPAVAQVGVHAQSDAARLFKLIHFDLKNQDRTSLDNSNAGFIKITHDKRGHIKGAMIVAESAGELIGEIVVAMNHNVSLSSLANAIHPFPSQSEMIKTCGDLYRRSLLTPPVAKLLDRILKWRR